MTHAQTDAVQAGIEHHRAGRLQDAERIYQGVLRADPQNAPALHLLGVIACQAGQPAAGLELIGRSLRIAPDNAEALSNHGLALHSLGRYDEAVANYDRALELKPDYADAAYNRGNALYEVRRHEDALHSYERALALQPGNATAWSNRGNTLQALGRHEEALASYERGLALAPSAAGVLYNRGNALYAMRRIDEALAHYEQAIVLEPASPEAWNNRGNAQHDLKRYGEALASFARAQALNPGYAAAHLNEAYCRLVTGDYEEGWIKHEWRWKAGHAVRAFAQPLWLGQEDLAGKTILLHAEQGLGDTIQFSRFAQAVADRGATVILEVQPALCALLGKTPGARRVVARGATLPAFDFHCPLMSLPLALGTRLSTVPAVPYLRPPQDALRSWRSRLGRKKGLRIGLAWSGSTSYGRDKDRNVRLEMLASLARPGVTLVSLQNKVRAEDEAALAGSGAIQHFGAEIDDVCDNAALVALMDVVISVDTAIVHLAGAMGQRAWLLQSFAPDWRWLAEGEASPWYPSVRLFRQRRAGDWQDVVDDVARELGKLSVPQRA